MTHMVHEPAPLSRKEPSSEPAPLLGQRVVLGGLSSRPELNGQRGVAGSFEDGRYAVVLEGGGESVRVRPGNLSPAAAERASSSAAAAPEAVVAAAERGEEEAVLAWLEGGGGVNATYERDGVTGLTLLVGAVMYGHERLVDLLLRRGADINQRNSRGGTALMCAAGNGNERVADLLIRCGAEINLQNSNGFTALRRHARPRAVGRLADTARC